MVILVTGSNGQLGQAIQKIAPKYSEFTFVFLTSVELDITDLDSCQKAFSTYQPAYCINTAAYTAVDKAESEEKSAYAVNTTGAQNLALVAKDYNAVLIHISTDFVFDGSKNEPYLETDATNPISIYGLTKLKGEQAIEKTWEKHYIIRTSWVFSEYGNNFMKTMIRLGNERDSLAVVSDQTGTPTYAPDLAEALLEICNANAKQNIKAYGIYNYSNEGQCTWYEFAKEIFKANNMAVQVTPIATTDYPTPAKRPAYSVFCKQKIKQTFGLSIKNWEANLKA